MKKTLEKLQRVTRECRNDMHEPDEQCINAVVSGFYLDNAHGDNPFENMGELTVGIIDEEQDDYIEWFNLATLIALARKAMLKEKDGDY